MAALVEAGVERRGCSIMSNPVLPEFVLSLGRETVLFYVSLFIYCFLFPAPGQNPNYWLGPPEPRRADCSASCLSAGQRGHGSVSAEVPCQLRCRGDAGLPNPHSTEVLPERVSNCLGSSSSLRTCLLAQGGPRLDPFQGSIQ